MTSLLLACPHCHKKNRLPHQRLQDNAHCGACKQTLFTGTPITIQGNNINAHLSADLPVVVDFWATWCGPCKQFAPTFTQLAGEFSRQLQFLKVETDGEPDLSQRFAIRSIPTLILFRQGKEIARLSGALPASQFRHWLTSHLA